MKLRYLLSLPLLLAPLATRAQSEGSYPVNYDESTAMQRTDRWVNSITFEPLRYEKQTIQVNQATVGKLYIKLLDQAFTARAGLPVLPAIDFNGTYMHGYLYIDLDRDGVFDVEKESATLQNSKDLLSFSYLDGKSSIGTQSSQNPGASPTLFTLPSTLKPGVYRIRYKVDWNSSDPGGSTTSGNEITTNGGAIIDTRLIIQDSRVTVNAVSTPGGTLLSAKGASLENLKTSFGKDLTVTVSPADGYTLSHVIVRHGYDLDGDSLLHDTPQYLDARISAREATDNSLVIPARYLDGDLRLTPVFVRNEEAAGTDDYPLHFDKQLVSADGSRLRSLTLTPSKSTPVTTLTIPDAQQNAAYLDAETTVPVVPGETLTLSTDYEGSALHGYFYLDLDQDGLFDTSLNADGTPSPYGEMLSYSYLNGRNSAGEAVTAEAAAFKMPSFTLPANLAPGVYRARFKADTNQADPAGQTTTDGIRILDFRLNVHTPSAPLDIQSVHGSVVGSGNTGLAESAAFGEALALQAVPIADGYTLRQLTVRHGHNLDGPQYLRGNRQWGEYMAAAPTGRFSIPADSVDGTVRVTADFEPDGTEAYIPVFSDEFNEADYSCPDTQSWSYSNRQSPTWKRFTAQTQAGQKVTNYIADGKLVSRCIPNPYSDETFNGNRVDMISGAIESSGKVAFTYGKVEGRLLTRGYEGNFPAFWMMPQNSVSGWPYDGEIDIWEQIDAQDISHHTIHSRWANGKSDGDLCQGQSQNPPKTKQLSGTTNGMYHTFGLEWTPEVLTWSVDGKEVFSYAKSASQSALNLGQWPFDAPFYLILNQSVGNNSWAKNAIVSHTYETLFDYVRVYQKPGGDLTGIASAPTDAQALKCYPYAGGVRIAASRELPVRVYDLQGRLAYAATVQGNADVPLMQGIYLLNGVKVLVP